MKKLVSGTSTLPHLVIETLDSAKLASKLNKEALAIHRPEPIGVLVQVQTSDEGTKFGVEQDNVMGLVDFIYRECPMLRFRGLMTMGRLHDVDGFRTMQGIREQIQTRHEIEPEQFILSMGTSEDFEEAVRCSNQTYYR